MFGTNWKNCSWNINPKFGLHLRSSFMCLVCKTGYFLKMRFFFCFLTLECLVLWFRWGLVSSNHFRIYLLIFRDNSIKCHFKKRLQGREAPRLPPVFPQFGESFSDSLYSVWPRQKMLGLFAALFDPWNALHLLLALQLKQELELFFSFDIAAGLARHRLLYRSWVAKGDRIGKLPILLVAMGELRCGRS